MVIDWSNITGRRSMVDTNMSTREDDDDELLTGNDVRNIRNTRRQRLTSLLNDAEFTNRPESRQGDRKKKEVLLLSYEETDSLLNSLEDATRVLTSHYELLHHTTAGRNPLEDEDTPPGRCQSVTDYMWKMLYTFTGARSISATVLLQLACLVMLTIIDGITPYQKKKDALKAGSIAMMVLQVINLIIVVMVSVQLLDQFQKKRVSRVLLLQYFVTTMLLFAGIYTASYRLDVKSWKFVEDANTEGSPVLIVTTYTRFLFFSASTATLCGAADALPKEWYTCLFVSAQMLLSFVYFTSVLSNVIIYQKKPKTRVMELRRELQTLRNNEWRRQAKDRD